MKNPDVGVGSVTVIQAEDAGNPELRCTWNGANHVNSSNST